MVFFSTCPDTGGNHAGPQGGGGGWRGAPGRGGTGYTLPVPIFQYVCRACDHPFEELVFGSEEPACPECQAEDAEKQFSTFASPSSTPDLPPPAALGGMGPGACGTCGDPRGPGACSN